MGSESINVYLWYVDDAFLEMFLYLLESVLNYLLCELVWMFVGFYIFEIFVYIFSVEIVCDLLLP